VRCARPCNLDAAWERPGIPRHDAGIAYREPDTRRCARIGQRRERAPGTRRIAGTARRRERTRSATAHRPPAMGAQG